jgi:hypothetical protein
MEHPQKGANQEARRNERIFGPDDLALDTGGQLRPSYEIVPKRAGRLACGELAVEYVLGPVRVADVARHGGRDSGEAVVQVAWADDYGPSTASAQYPVDRVFPVRMPGPADRFSIRQTLDRAERLHRDIPEDTARLVAAHLHTGPWSALYDFAVDGGIRDRLFEELDDIRRHRPYARTWVQALARYCLSRDDLGPLKGWRATRGAAWAERKARAARIYESTAGSTDDGPLCQEFMRSDLAGELIDAAFMIGRATRRMDTFASGSLVKVVRRLRLAG